MKKTTNRGKATNNWKELMYLSGGKDPKLPSTGIVPQRSLLETSLHNRCFKLADKSTTKKKKTKKS